MHKNILTVVGITILFLGLCITPSVAIDNVKKTPNPIGSGNTLYVGGSGEGNYTKIQDAINDAVDGDTVFVYSGIYYENLRINKAITVMGENKETTVIDGNKKDDVIVLCDDASINITGFTIQNSKGVYHGIRYAGIYIVGTYNIVTDNIIKDNYYGIMICDLHNTISNNIIKNNTNYGIEISTWHGIDNKIIDNIFEENDSIYINLWDDYSNKLIIDNNTANGKPIRCYINEENVIVPSDTSQVILIHCNRFTIKNIIFTELDIGILIISGSQHIYINENTFSDNSYAGVMIESYPSYNNNISNNIFADNYIGVYLRDDTEATTIYGNTMNNNKYGILSPPTGVPTTNEHQSFDISHTNTICNNNITNNDFGMSITYGMEHNINNNNIMQNEYGIELETCYGNHIYQNDIIDNHVGIFLHSLIHLYCNENHIFQNNIKNNQIGIKIISSNLDTVEDNEIYQNNFIENKRNAVSSKNNKWYENYWDNWIGIILKNPIFQIFPKRIPRSFIGCDFDWHPAKELYDI